RSLHSRKSMRLSRRQRPKRFHRRRQADERHVPWTSVQRSRDSVAGKSVSGSRGLAPEASVADGEDMTLGVRVLKADPSALMATEHTKSRNTRKFSFDFVGSWFRAFVA